MFSFGGQVAEIFISYRRSDSQANTDRIYASLVKAFGRKAIFKDVDDIPPGVDFPSYLQNKVQDAKIVLIIIGKQWASAAYEDGSLRLNDPEDFVRVEVELALKMRAAWVIPILVNNASMPNPNHLPESIRAISRLNAMQVRNDPDFENDIKRLIRKLNELGLGRGKNYRLLIGLAVAILLAFLVGYFLLQPFLNNNLDATNIAQYATETSEANATASRASTTIISQSETADALASLTQASLDAEASAQALLDNDATATALAELEPSLEPSMTLAPTQENTPNPLEDAISLASTRMTSNSQWQAHYPDGFSQDFNGVTMVLVPAGCFEMGADPQASYFNDDRQLAQGVEAGGNRCFEPFWIDRYEVSQQQFRDFEVTNVNAYEGLNRPVEQITWFEARDFCALRGASLPTEAEWEYAARGPDSLYFPWGNAADSSRAVQHADALGTLEIGSTPSGKSWVGALDMAGNVWEWTRSLYRPYPYEEDDGREADMGNNESVLYAMHGGSYDNDGYGFPSASRLGFEPSYTQFSVGFRCMRPLR
jgi:formylglycine-generating enzyme required for sulfatase activity